jgi:hypothetical protein
MEFYDDDRHGVEPNFMMTMLDVGAATIKFGRACPV